MASPSLTYSPAQIAFAANVDDSSVRTWHRRGFWTSADEAKVRAEAAAILAGSRPGSFRVTRGYTLADAARAVALSRLSGGRASNGMMATQDAIEVVNLLREQFDALAERHFNPPHADSLVEMMAAAPVAVVRKAGGVWTAEQHASAVDYAASLNGARHHHDGVVIFLASHFQAALVAVTNPHTTGDDDQ